MGGGGNSYNPGKNISNGIKKTNEQTDNNDFERQINELINEKLKKYNDRDSQIVNEHLDEIFSIINSEFDGSIKLKFGGSVSKHTYVEGLSDADILVLINNSELSDYSPKQVIQLIKSKLSSHLSNVQEIREGKLAVTVKFQDGTEIQLLPALQSRSGYKIPERNGKCWSNVTRPDQFASKLTQINQKCGNKVIPVIKLIKGINANLPPNQQLSGYHIESLAIEIFKNYPRDQSNTPKNMLKYFFEQSQKRIITPIKDKTNQSIHVDDYLGEANSNKRYESSYVLKRIHSKISRADSSKSKAEWEDIIGDV